MDCLISENLVCQKEEGQKDIQHSQDQQNQKIESNQEKLNNDGGVQSEIQKQVVESDFIKNLRMLREQQKEKVDSFKQQKLELKQQKEESIIKTFQKFKEEKILKEKQKESQNEIQKNLVANLKKKVEEKVKFLQSDNLLKSQESLFLKKPIQKTAIQPPISNKKKYLPTDLKYMQLIKQNPQKISKNKFIRKSRQPKQKMVPYKGEGETIFVYKQPPKHPIELEKPQQKQPVRVYDDSKIDEEIGKKQYKKLVSDEEQENKLKNDFNYQKQQNQISVLKLSKLSKKFQQKQSIKEEKQIEKNCENLKQNDISQTKQIKNKQPQLDNLKSIQQQQTSVQQNLQDKKQEQNHIPSDKVIVENRQKQIQSNQDNSQQKNESYKQIQQKVIKTQNERENILKQKQYLNEYDNDYFSEEDEDEYSFRKERKKQKQTKSKIEKTSEQDEYEYRKFLTKDDQIKQKQQQLHDIVTQKLSKLQLKDQSKIQTNQNSNETQNRLNNNISINQKNFDTKNSTFQEKIVDVSFLKKQYLDQNSAKNYNNNLQTDRERSRDYKSDSKKQSNMKDKEVEFKKIKQQNFIDVEEDSDKEVNDFLLNNKIKNFIKTQSQIIEECQKQIMEEKIKESQENKQKETKSILKNGQNSQGKYSLIKETENNSKYQQPKGYNEEGQVYKSPINRVQTKQYDDQFMNRIQNSNKKANLEKAKTSKDVYEIEEEVLYDNDKLNQNAQDQFYDRQFKSNINPNQNNKQNVINQILDVRPIQIINDRPIQIIDESQIKYYDERQVNYINGNNQNFIDRLTRRSSYEDKIRQYNDGSSYIYENPKRRIFRQDFQQFPDNFVNTPEQEIETYDNQSQFLRYQNYYNQPRPRETVNNINNYINPLIPTPSPKINVKPHRDYSFLNQTPQSNSNPIYQEQINQKHFEIPKQAVKPKIEIPKPQPQNQFLNDYFSQAKEQDRQTLAQMFEGRNRFKQFNVDSFY